MGRRRKIMQPSLGKVYLPQKDIDRILEWLRFNIIPDSVDIWDVGKIIENVKNILVPIEEKTTGVAPFDPNKARYTPVCARNGNPVRIIAYERYSDRPLVGLENNGDFEEVYCYYPDGNFYNNGRMSEHDLMLVVEEKTGWVNVYEEPDGKKGILTGDIFQTEQEARENISETLKYKDTVMIRWKG